MDIMTAMKERHSVRSYQNRPLEPKVQEKLEECIKECNEECGLHIQLVTNEPKAFDSTMAHYGKFSGVTNYIAMIGKKTFHGKKCLPLYLTVQGRHFCKALRPYF